MPLSKEGYQALEAIVGAEYISDDPAILDSYSFIFPHTGESYLVTQMENNQGHFAPRPDAAILPGNTEEVQAIVRVCNTYGMKLRALSTGWIFLATPVSEGVIILDMRRMNRILEIDRKNMYAVIEPYVIAAQLQAEAMKVGLNCNLIGAGASCSPLAQSTSFAGHGPGSIYMGHASEVLLALEWVMPNGEILRTGSLGAGCGWFCGEGPGPSLRGIVKGKTGAFGGLGVFTKCAVKLSAWAGPTELNVEGTIPAYNSTLPENFASYTVAFKDWQACANAYYQIWDSEIGYIVHRQFNVLGGDLSYAFLKMYTDPSMTLSDMEELVKRHDVQEITDEMRISFQIIFAGTSRGDFEYQEKVLNKILADTGGWKVAAMSDPDMEKFTYLYMVRLGHKNLNHTYSGGAGASNTEMSTPDTLMMQVPTQAETLAKYQESGLLVKTGGDSMMGCIGPMGGGTYSILEQFQFYDPHDIDSVKKSIEFQREVMKTLRERGFNILSAADNPVCKPKQEAEAALLRTSQPVIFYLQNKIKQALDPNCISAPGYSTLDRLPEVVSE